MTCWANCIEKGAVVVRVRLITNSRSGRGTPDLTEPIALLQARGWDVQVREKRHGGQATDLALEAAQEGFDVVVGCAGDGTVSEIVDGLVGTGIAVGVVPYGTANLWARELGISRRLALAAAQLADAEKRQVDVGYVSVNERYGRHFLLMAGLGFDGATMGHVSKPFKRRMGAIAVGLAAVPALATYRGAIVSATIDGAPWHGRVSQVVVGNTRRYGGFTQITPQAYVDDGLLDICLFRASNLIGTGRQLASLVFQHHPSPHSAESFRASSFVLEAPEVIPMQVDGGVARLKKIKPKSGTVTYRFSVVPGGVTMLVPRDYSGPLFQNTESASSGASAGTPLDPEAQDARSEAMRRVEKERRWRFRVVSIETNSVTGAHVVTGQAMSILIEQDTIVETRDGESTNGAVGRFQFHEGDIVQVKGQRADGDGALRARRIKVLATGW